MSQVVIKKGEMWRRIISLTAAAALLMSTVSMSTPAQAAPTPVAFTKGQALIFVAQTGSATGNNGTQLYTAVQGTGDNTASLEKQGAVDPTNTNAIGFDLNDMYIYGIQVNTNKIIQMGQNGVQVVLGTVSGLPAYGTANCPSGYNTGTMGEGAYSDTLFVRGGSNSAGLKMMWAIDNVSVHAAQGTTFTARVINLSMNVPNCADFVAADNYLWAFYGNDTGLSPTGGPCVYRIDPATGTTAVFPLNDASGNPIGVATDSYGAQWVYGNGWFGILGNTLGNLYQIALNGDPAGTPTFTLINTLSGPPTSGNDGTSYPGEPIDLSLTKTVAPTYVPGNPVTFTMTVKNEDENYDSTGFVVTDMLPAGLLNPTSSTPGVMIIPLAPGMNMLTYSGGELGPQQTDTIEVTGDTDPSAMPPSPIVNTATVTGNEADSNPDNNSDTATTTAVLNPATSVVKSVQNLTPHADGKNYVGDTLEYTINVANDAPGTSLWPNVVATDAVPAGLVIDASSLMLDSAPTGTVTGQDITVPLGDLANGDSHTITFKATIGPALSGVTIKNVAVADGISSPPAITPVEPAPANNKTVKNLTHPGAAQASVGDILQYTITATNTNAAGGTASVWPDVMITDAVPAGLAIDASSLTLNGSQVTTPGAVLEQNITVNAGNIYGGDTKTVTFQATVGPELAGTTIDNVAVVGGTDTPHTITPVAPSTKSIKTVTNLTHPGAAQASVGDVLQYTITATNTNSAAPESVWPDVVITDAVPAGLAIDASSLMLNNSQVTTPGAVIGQNITVDAGNIYGSTPKVVTFNVTVGPELAGTSVTNVAVVDGTETLPVVTPIEPAKAIVKAVIDLTPHSDGKTYAGDTLKYTITATNTNSANPDSIWPAVTITDAVPVGLTVVPGTLMLDDTIAGAISDQNVITVDAGDIAGGHTATVTFNVTVGDELAGTSITNVAVADGVQTLPVVTPVEPATANNKTVRNLTHPGAAQASVGDVLQYIITATNTNSANFDSVWPDVSITDAVPAGLTIDASSLMLNNSQVTTPGAVVEQNVTVDAGNINGGVTKTLTFNVTVGAVLAGTSVTNVAVVDGVQTPPAVTPVKPATANNKTVVDMTPHGDGKIYVGDTLQYVITATNTNSADPDSIWPAVTITDAVPAGLAIDATSLKLDGSQVTTPGAVLEQNITVNTGDIRGGVTQTVTFNVTVGPELAGMNVTNVAVVDGTDTPAVVVPIEPTGARNKTVKDLTPHPDGKVYAGDMLEYTITATNTNAAGGTASVWPDVVFTDAVPVGLTIIPGSLMLDDVPTGSISDQNSIFVDAGDIAGGETRTVTFEVIAGDVLAGTTFTNIAVVGGTQTPPVMTPEEPLTANNKIVNNLTHPKAAQASVGDVLQYVITATNTNSENPDSVWPDVSITDAVPAGLTIDASSLRLDGSQVTTPGAVSGQNVSVNAGDIYGGITKTVIFNVTVDPELAGTSVTNVASVNGTSTPQVVTPVEPAKDLEKAVTNLTPHADGKTYAGDTLRYTITATNTNSDNPESLWPAVVINDTVPAGLTIVPGTLELNGAAVGTFTGQNISVAAGDIYGGDHQTVTFEVTVGPELAGKTITNVATTSDDATAPPVVTPVDPATDNNKTVENITHPGAAVASVGDVLQYTITATNTNSAASDSVWPDVTISDDVPAGLSIIDGSLKLDGSLVTTPGATVGQMITVAAGDIYGGITKTVTFQATVGAELAGTSVDNVAVVDGTPTPHTSTPVDPATDNNKTVENLTHPGAAQASVGDVLQYTITAANTNAAQPLSVWPDVSITDNVPAGLTIDATSLELDGSQVTTPGAVTGQTISIAAGDIYGGVTKTVTFNVTVGAELAGKSADNVASVGGTPTPHTVTPVDPAKDLEKTVTNLTPHDDGKTYIGDTLEYTITATNANSAAPDSVWPAVVITDGVPAGLTIMPDTLRLGRTLAGTVSGQQIRVDAGNIYGGQNQVVTFDVTVGAELAGKSVTNVAVTSDDTTSLPVITAVAPTKDLEKTVTNLTRSDGKTYVGDTLLYTITATNTNQAAPDSVWPAVVVNDDVPAGLTIDANSLELDGATVGTITGQNISVAVGDIMGGQHKAVTFEVTVGAEFAGKTITNVATTSDDTTSLPATIPVAPTESLDKTVTNLTPHSDGKTYAGDTLQYTITATNTNSAAPDSVWSNATIADDVPAGLTVVPNTLMLDGQAAGVITGQMVTVNAGNIAGGQTKTVTFDVTVGAELAGKSVTNVAASDETTTSPVTTSVEPAKDLEKTATNLTPHTDGKTYEGDTLQYTITATNTNSVAPDSVWPAVVINDEVPAGLMIDSGSLKLDGTAVGTVSGQNITVNAGDIYGGVTKTITFNVTVGADLAGENITNVATSGDTTTSPVITPVVPTKSLKKTEVNLTPHADGKTYAGDTLQYTITATNTNSDAPDSVWPAVVINDEVPAGLTIDSSSLELDGVAAGTVTGQNISVNAGDINGGVTKTVTFNVTVGAELAGKTITNVATTSDDTTAPPVTTPVTATKSLDKTVTNVTPHLDGKTYAGDTLRYTITAANTNSAAVDSVWPAVTITDDVPAGLTIESNSLKLDGTAAGAVSGQTITVDAGDINGGQSKVVTFEVTVDSSLAGKDVTNVAAANGMFSNPVPTEVDKVVKPSPLALPKTGDVVSVMTPLLLAAAVLFFLLLLTYKRRQTGESRQA